ncbi:MAG: phosphodiester glycosidase family protein [Nocardioides sp.]
MRTQRILLAGLTTSVVACALLAGPSAPAADGERRADRSSTDLYDGPRPRHSSDGIRGAIAAPLPSFMRGRSTTTTFEEWQVAPGVQATKWDESTIRGPIRAQLLTVALDTPGIKIDYAYAGQVSRTSELTDILARSGAIAGVNGDFFDIGDTGAPLGLGQDRQERLLNAPASGWNSAFVLDAAGVPDVTKVPMRATYKQHPRFKITNINAPEVRPGGIGVYTEAWGPTAGYRVTDGQRKHVRMVKIRNGRVVANSRRLTTGRPIQGKLLIGRGNGASDLRRLVPGRKATVRAHLDGRPTVAITGNKFLVSDGLIVAEDDREMHPRTAIGIDRETNSVLLLVVDGRQSFSRGYTMVELANKMIDLGADEALNLDGGGSSTMVARKSNGQIGVINSPSDGGQRLVPNGVEITYEP